MSITVGIDALGFGHIAADGDVVIADFVASLSGFYQDPQFAQVENVLCDLRTARIKLSAVEIRQLVGYVRARRRAGRRRTAVVASEDLAFGLSRMFGAWTESSAADSDELEMRVFRDADAATAWLQGT